MNKYLVITIDVEPDCSSDWRYSNPLAFSGVSEGVANRLQPLFNKYHIAPTYLINNVVLENPSSVQTFRHLDGNYELGTHLHPEFIEPLKLYENYAGMKGEANGCHLPPSVESEKIQNITRLFRDAFGYGPVSFRAGRFSAGPNTIQTLKQLGYRVDSSVTPHINWNDRTREKPIDYTRAPEQPYFADSFSILRENGGRDLLEVPVSIGLRKTNFVREALVSAAGLRHPYRKFKPVWIRPSFTEAADMIFVADQLLDNYQDRDAVVFNMMFHNVEAMPGLSPYTSSEEECKAFLGRLESFIVYCTKTGVHSVTLSDLYHVFRK